MTDFPRSFGVDYVGGYVQTTKDNSEIIRDAVVSLLVQKFPEKLSDEEIADFVKTCRVALQTVNSVPKDK